MTAKAVARVEWVRITTRRRVAFGIAAVVILLVFAALAWFVLQGRRAGMIDMGLLGATLGGGVFSTFTAITGKEKRKIVHL